MRSGHFQSLFEQTLQNYLNNSQDNLRAYFGSCKYALNDSISSINLHDINQGNMNVLKADYYRRIDELASNFSRKGQPGVYFI